MSCSIRIRVQIYFVQEREDAWHRVSLVRIENLHFRIGILKRFAKGLIVQPQPRAVDDMERSFITMRQLHEVTTAKNKMILVIDLESPKADIHGSSRLKRWRVQKRPQATASLPQPRLQDSRSYFL